MTAAESVLHDIRNSIESGSVSARSPLLRYVTDLYLVSSDQLSDEDIALFDDVFTRLIAEIEHSARALLALRLARVRNAPRKTIRWLALDSDIDVARPVLIDSKALDDALLVETAQTQGQEHLLAISRRHSLSPAVTDVLVERGDPQVLFSTAENRGAKFSDTGYATVVRRAEGDDRLAACVGARSDIPNHLFLRLLAKASDRVRARLEAEHPFAKRDVGEAVDEAVARVGDQAFAGSADIAAAEAARSWGEFNDAKIQIFAKSDRLEETTAALAAMCRLPVSFVTRAMAEDRAQTLLVLARAIGLSWPTVKAVLLLPARKRPMLAGEIAQCLANFERLSRMTSKEILGFYQAREPADPAESKHPN